MKILRGVRVAKGAGVRFPAQAPCVWCRKRRRRGPVRMMDTCTVLAASYTGPLCVPQTPGCIFFFFFFADSLSTISQDTRRTRSLSRRTGGGLAFTTERREPITVVGLLGE